MKSISLFALAVIASAATITPTVAAESAMVTSSVRTVDLDLSTSAGQRELNARIAMAAREVCGSASDVDLEGKNAIRACREETIAQAAAQREQLLALARTGAPILVASAR